MMTSTTLATETLHGVGRGWVAAPRPAPRPTSPQADQGRRVLAAFAVATAVALAAMFVLGLLAAPGGDPASASGSAPRSAAATVHVAAPGDTLWSIARAHRGEVDLDRYLERLIRLNGGTEIQIGQAVALP
jgi:hypothetical protein